MCTQSFFLTRAHAHTHTICSPTLIHTSLSFCVASLSYVTSAINKPAEEARQHIITLMCILSSRDGEREGQRERGKATMLPVATCHYLRDAEWHPHHSYLQFLLLSVLLLLIPFFSLHYCHCNYILLLAFAEFSPTIAQTVVPIKLFHSAAPNTAQNERAEETERVRN